MNQSMTEQQISDQFEIRLLELKELNDFVDLSRSTYYEAYHQKAPEETLQYYMKTTYNHSNLEREILEPQRKTMVIYNKITGKMYGYCMINMNKRHDMIESIQPHSEINRFYIDKKYHGTGLSKWFMNHIIQWISQFNIHHLWLCVWKENDIAQKFYRKLGFGFFGLIQPYQIDGLDYPLYIYQRSP
ncbi:hypothetical protein HDV02_003823 [Globomyces sp. JEL0801]|nr:hypothetical protein HDV02_003823 [Globomyces sp. JEL0801]